MDTVFLPGNIRQRLLDLMKHNNVSQTELARKIGCNDSLLSRFLSEKTDKLGDENIIRIARAFNVSTDFLLGVTTVPDRKNYEIDELGLSAQVARNLYTGKANAQVVNYLLESPRFLELTYILEQYFNDTVAAGYAAQNQLYATLSSLTRKSAKTKAAAQAANEINRLKTPVYQADLVTIENQFMMAVKEVKKEIGNDFAAIRAMTAEEAEKMFSEITKCQDMENLTVTPKQVSDLIIGSVAGMDCVDPDALNTLGEALTTPHHGRRTMSKPSNEYLCALAQKGDTPAADLLLEYNSDFIRKVANEIFLKSNLVESDLSIEIGDLEQEGGIGLLKAIPSYDKSIGVKFLTYAAPFIRNAMTDLVRDSFSRYEQRMVDPQNGLGLQKIRLDEILPGEERLLRIEAVADITAKSPEQVYEDRETLRELYEGFGQISEREQTYLLYRYGFTDDIGHTLIGTAIHFNLSESRAKKLEGEAMDNLWLELPWWF